MLRLAQSCVFRKRLARIFVGQAAVNFDLSEDESLLKALAERFVTDRYDLDKRRAYLAEPNGFSAANWKLLGELGLTATAFSSEHGGLGSSPVELIVLHEALGRGLVAEPLIDCAVLAGGLFEAVAPPALHAAWVPGLAAGEKRLAFAHRELAARGRLEFVATRAEAVGDGWRLDGEKAVAAGEVGADALLVSARLAGAADADGIALFLVPVNTPGVRLTPYRLIDGSLAAKVTLAAATLPAGARLEGGLAQIAAAEARANLCRAAEAVGLMDMLLQTTLEYLRTRKQFGVAIGSFQAVQHRMVAQYVAVEQARSLLYRAAMANGRDRSAEQHAVAGARAFIAEASVALGHEAIQLHGGMGVSDEMAVTHAHKRLFLLSRHPAGALAALDEYAGLGA